MKLRYGSIAVVISILFLAGATSAQATDHARTCSTVRLGTTEGAVSAQYCVPRRANRVLQVLVHGGTYNHDYWDWRQFDGAYSYVDKANEAGYATLNLDRIGDGASFRPKLAVADTYTVQVDALHQVVQQARRLHAGPVELVGHSYGSLYVEGDLAAHPRDADAVILTGSGHTTTAVINAISKATTYPANNLERFAGLDAGYLTSRPGTRAALVYDPTKADPRVIAYDEATEDTLALGEAQTRPADQGALSIKIQVPVLLMDGNTDDHYCGPDVDNCASQATFRASEAPYFHTRLTTVLVSSGHDIQLSYVSPQADAIMLAWSNWTLDTR